MFTVKLKKGAERRIHLGHPWIFSNELERMEEKPQPGSDVRVLDWRGSFLGRGYINPHSLIAVRILSRRDQDPDGLFVRGRVEGALALRRALYRGEETYRLLNSEGDGLPGAVVDRFGDTLVVSITTAGMELRKGWLLEALRDIVEPAQIYLKCDSPARALEGLDEYSEWLLGGQRPEPAIEQDGIGFTVDVVGGQKTGFFLDQRPARRRLASWAEGHRVLDAFCYTGAFACYAARSGARDVVGVESSAPAVGRARAHAEANGLEGKVTFLEGDAWEVLKTLHSQGERFGCAVVDPPSFARSKKDLKEAGVAYERLNRLAMKLLEPGGLLITSTCSYHVDEPALRRAVLKAAYSLRRSCTLLESGGQGPDHPTPLAMSEGRYLTTLYLRMG
jgi:23S rRNA (cytosine1962-C5)-methyltransferase